MGFLIAALIIIACLALSWGVTVGVVKLITMCFGWSFSMPIATGIWLVLGLLECFFKSGKGD